MKKFVVFILLFSAVMLVSSSAYAAVEIKYGSPSANSSTSTIVDVNFPCPSGDIGGVPCIQGVTKDTSFIDYIIKLYQFGIAIAGILAVAMIVAGGIYMSATGNIDKKSEGREMIKSAIFGILILFGTYLILNTINPELVTLKTSVPFKVVVPKKAADEKAQGCSDLKTIKYLHTEENPDNNSGCFYNKVITKKALKISDTNYYNLSWYNFSWKIPMDSKIWSYPYYLKSTKENPGGPGTAACLIYAYLEPDKTSIQEISLNSNAIMCSNAEQDNTVQGGVSLNTADALIRKELENAGIFINKDPCPNPQETNCTSVAGLPRNAIDFLKTLKQSCTAYIIPTYAVLGGTKKGSTPVKTNCLITVTGGTEKGHLTHGPGEPVVDLRINFPWLDAVSNYDNQMSIAKYLSKDPSVNVICMPSSRPNAPGEDLVDYKKNCEVDEGDHIHFKLK